MVRDIVEAVIREIIQPLIQTDGGEITLISVGDNEVVLRLSGMCAGCPGKTYTTSRIIEPLLKKKLGETVSIRYDDGLPCSS